MTAGKQKPKNLTLLKIVDKIRDSIQGKVDFKLTKIKAHAAKEGNEQADRLAVAAADMSLAMRKGKMKDPRITSWENVEETNRKEMFAGKKDPEKVRVMGQLLGFGAGTGKRWGWVNRGEHVECVVEKGELQFQSGWD